MEARRRPRNIKQVGIVNNEASAVGPAVEFTSQTPGGPRHRHDHLADDQRGLSGSRPRTAPSSIRFAVDGVLHDTATSTNATFTWHIDSGSTHIPDGTYIVSVTAFDAEGIPGPTRSRTLRLNRAVPGAPQDVFGGWNSRWGYATDIVELQWVRNTEPDVTGYRVYRKTGVRRTRSCRLQRAGPPSSPTAWT